MAIEVTLDSGFNPDQRSFVNMPCRCHLFITDVDEEGTRLGKKSDTMIVEFEVLAASEPSQVGLSHWLYLGKQASQFWIIHRFAIAIGVITTEEIKQLQAAGKNPVYDFEPGAIKKQLFGEIISETYKDEERLKIQPGGLHRLDDKSCCNIDRWPRNQIYIAKSGIVMPAASKTAEPAAKTNGTKAAEPVKAAAALGNLKL